MQGLRAVPCLPGYLEAFESLEVHTKHEPDIRLIVNDHDLDRLHGGVCLARARSPGIGHKGHLSRWLPSRYRVDVLGDSTGKRQTAAVILNQARLSLGLGRGVVVCRR